MSKEGGCYCGAIRYRTDAEPAVKAQCHCRECQYFAGGSSNLTQGIPEADFSYTKGTPKQFTRSDLDSPVTRDFCGECGTQLVSWSPALPGMALIKIGTLDDPSSFGGAQIAIFTTEKQRFHHIPADVETYDMLPAS